MAEQKQETPRPPDSDNQPPPRLDSEQCQRASLIAESRGIDDDTAFELVYLRDRSAALQAQLDEAQESIALLKEIPVVANDAITQTLGQIQEGAIESFRQRAVAAVRAKQTSLEWRNLQGECDPDNLEVSNEIIDLLQQLPATTTEGGE